MFIRVPFPYTANDAVGAKCRIDCILYLKSNLLKTKTETIMTDIEVTEINVAYPEVSDLHLKMSIGACTLNVEPGDGETWVSGTYSHPSDTLPSIVEQESGMVRITQEGWGDTVTYRNLFDSEERPRFDLTFGKSNPFKLTLEGGAYEGNFDLGGLPISRMMAKQGAGKFHFNFSAPSPQAMSLLKVEAGAADLKLMNLANANFAEMSLDGGMASYKLDFGGTLQRDAHVKINTGMASVELLVPASTAAKIIDESTLSRLTVGDGFTEKEGAYWTEAALAGETPLLTIDADVSVGALSIQTA